MFIVGEISPQEDIASVMAHAFMSFVYYNIPKIMSPISDMITAIRTEVPVQVNNIDKFEIVSLNPFLMVIRGVFQK